MDRYSGVVSVVIPALNEERYLPRLLDALAKQSRKPDQVIVADAGSTDRTVDVARAAGAIVVVGGRPAVGRNAGARLATGDALLFLDADVVPAAQFVEQALAEFDADGLDVAAPLVSPLSDRRLDHLLCEITNVLLQLLQGVSPHAGGFCILARREMHVALGGFDETAVMAEDHDYVQRAAHIGRFGMLTTVQIPVSVRRLEKEGTVQLAAKYLYCELFALSGRPVRSLPFDYQFGSFSQGRQRLLGLVDVRRLREQLGSMDDPLSRLGEHGVRVLRSLASLRLDPEAFEQRVEALFPDEISVLRQYALRRLAVLRRVGRPVLRATVRRLRSVPFRDAIALLDMPWWGVQPGSDADALDRGAEGQPADAGGHDATLVERS